MIKTHEAWLATLMAGFMSKTQNKQVLFDFSDILFRHFTWLENELIKMDEPYSYDRDAIPIKVEKLADLLCDIDKRLSEIDLQLLSSPDKNLNSRIATDIKYMRDVIGKMDNEDITAFNMDRKFPGIELTEEATDALTLFLFEETYKEYELIMIYNYLKAHSTDAYLNRIFQILIDESFFHLKSFGDMGAKMGILAVPRLIMKEMYQVEDVVQFLKDGINEELAAKEECKKLADAVAKDSPELEKFFDFINHQENYHISLMEDALEHFAKGNNVYALYFCYFKLFW
jgi:rubrerythrin